MSDLAIRVEGLSKCYRLGTRRVRHDTLRDLLMDRLSWRGNSGNARQAEQLFWALKDVSLDVRQGEAVGLLGRNGAGKSTLLKILSRITEPTAGRAEIHGRVGSLLEVGTGFDRELSGRENIYLNGAILGMRKAEIDRRFDEIVAFSEIERFIDTPVKRYSSGMYVRLAFAVAAHLEPEVLFVDEVLAVGDASFQKKCLGKMGEVSRESRTLVFVSHNMAAITRLCKWGIWIEGGQVREIGPAVDVAMHYLETNQQDTGEVKFTEGSERPPGSEYIRLMGARLRDDHGKVTTVFGTRSSQTLEIEYRILRRTPNIRLGFGLVTYDGTVIFSSRDVDGQPEACARMPGDYIARCTIPANLLGLGQYAVTLVCDTRKIQVHFRLDRVLVFRVEDLGSEADPAIGGGGGLVRLALPWTLERAG
jgi:lipopolysaccharide transport system ATP-binding protein